MAGHSVTMSQIERSALWKQRVFEAAAGMTRYLTEHHGGRDHGDWLRLCAQMFADLPDDADSAGWQRIFFRAQALMERFLVTRYGHGELKGWADANAEVHRYVERDNGNGALDPALRIARQAELYSSEYRVPDAGSDRATIEIDRCGIWDYRERARARGVPITLDSPCEYCTHAIGANVAAKGFQSRYTLIDGANGHGCRWEITARTGAHTISADESSCAE
ncbi:hypothetical protein [Nocardia sp. NPDC050175]|uniref:hypothetical protein n=1 Tax=Nocardia sp. NPDC050175 TaxID=3364317 RepID=UPI0037AC3D92